MIGLGVVNDGDEDVICISRLIITDEICRRLRWLLVQSRRAAASLMGLEMASVCLSMMCTDGGCGSLFGGAEPGNETPEFWGFGAPIQYQHFLGI